MDRITLGRSDLKVSPICFGTWELGGEWGTFDEATAVAAIRDARELGINFFDTAQGYGFGASERILGDALGEELLRARDDVVIATKGGLRPVNGGLARDASRAWLREGVDASLRALGVEAIDLYQVHWPDPITSFEETAEALAELVDEGKIRHAGVSNFSAAEMDAFSEYGPLETLQPPYHMFRREIEDAVLPYCRAHDIGVLVYGPLAHGMLTGAMNPSTRFAPDDWRSKSSDFTGETFARNLAVVDRLKRVAADRGVTLPVLTVAWTLANPAVDVAIVGTRGPAHVAALTGAVDVRLSDDELAEITTILSDAVPVHGPTPEGM
jgi:aryl-alcohol dehydrogenase-like predicted oxidoreductase